MAIDVMPFVDLCVAIDSNGWATWGDPTTSDSWSASG
jgi:hypothetical protein